MNPCLITYYDNKEWQLASCSYATALSFSIAAGIDMVAEPSGGIVSGAISGAITNTGSFDIWPYMKKVQLCINELGAGRPYVVWADADIVFNKDADVSVLTTYTASLNVISTDNTIPESSFFIAYPDALPFFDAWSASYQSGSNVSGSTTSSANVDTDEPAFIALFIRNRYSGSLAPSVKLIPSFPYMATPMNNMDSGSIGKHFYATLLGMTESLVRMKRYKALHFG